MGLLDELAGSYDPATADPQTGLVEAQRRQLAASSLGNIGGILLAAGAEQMPSERASKLAQLGNAPAQTQAISSAMTQQNWEAQRTQAAQRQNRQQQELMQFMQSPEFQKQFESLPPATKAVAIAQGKAGDVSGMVKTLQEARAETTPKFGPDGSIYDPVSGDVMYPMTGQRYNIRAMQTAQGQQPGPLSGPPGADLHGEDYLKTLSPSFAATVKAIDEGRMAMPSGQIMRTQYGQYLMAALNQYAPGFEGTNYNARNNTAKAFASGKEATAVRALNQVTQHMMVLHEKAAQLSNTGSPILNYGINTIGANVFGSTGPTGFLAAAHPVAEELSRAFKGANLSDAEVRSWERSLGRDMSPAQMQDAMETMQRLLEGAQDALSEQYKKTMGKDLNPITPKSAEAIAFVKNHPLDKPEMWPENRPAGAPAIPGQPVRPQQGQRQQPQIDPALLDEARRRGIIR